MHQLLLAAVFVTRIKGMMVWAFGHCSALVVSLTCTV